MEFKELKELAKDLNTRFNSKIKVVAISAANLQEAVIAAMEVPGTKLLKKHLAQYEELTGHPWAEGMTDPVAEVAQDEVEPTPAPKVKLKGSPGKPPQDCECPEYGRDFDPTIEDCAENCDWSKDCKAVFVAAVEAGNTSGLGDNWKASYKAITGNDPAPKVPKEREGKAGGGGKKTGSKKEAGPKKPGVISTILSTLQDKGPISKEDILEELVRCFPEREAVSMSKTINVQVPGRISKERGIKVEKDDKGRFFIA